MRGREKRAFKVYTNPDKAEPFSCVEEAWFWFIQANEARNDGARITTGSALFPKPCEPIDILKVLDHLRRNRILNMEHFRVLRHYGRRMLAPDTRRIKEARAVLLWDEAIKAMEPLSVRKGIVKEQGFFPFMEAVQ